MADDLDFESFDKLDDLDWTELEKDVKEGAPAAAAAEPGGAPSAGPENTGMISGSGQKVDINYLLDVDLQLTVEVGRRHFFISEILSWDSGSIIELEKIVGEPLNLLVNGKPVAKGEVVVVNDKFALKIVEILDPHDRLLFLQS